MKKLLFFVLLLTGANMFGSEQSNVRQSSATSLINRLFMYGMESSPYGHVADDVRRPYAEMFCKLTDQDIAETLEKYQAEEFSERFIVAYFESERLVGHAGLHVSVTARMACMYLNMFKRRRVSIAEAQEGLVYDGFMNQGSELSALKAIFSFKDVYGDCEPILKWNTLDI